MKRAPSTRGYAMLLVLLVLLILALSMGTLVWHLSANIAETRRVVTTIRANAGASSTLDAAGRVITETFRTNPSADPETLLNQICKKPGADCNSTTSTGAILPRHLAPPGIDLIDFNIMTIRQRSPTTRRIEAGPFIDRLAVEEAVLVMAAVQDEKTGRRAVHIDRYVTPSIPITNFALFGTAPRTQWAPPLTIRRLNDSFITSTCNPQASLFNGCGSRIHLNGNLGGITTTDFPTPTAQVATDQPAINLTTSTRGTDLVLRPRVAAPTMSTRQTGLPESFRWLVDAPRAGDSTTQRAARLAVQADLVIIDGVWYLNVDKTQPWPGRPIFSEHGGTALDIPDPASDVVASSAQVAMGDLGWASGQFPKLYSWYDRPDATDPIQDQGTNGVDGGVISYGPLAVKTSTDSCTSDADCGTDGRRQCYRATINPGVCISMVPGAWTTKGVCGWSGSEGGGFVAVTDCNNTTGRVGAMLDGTRSGFRDNEKRILPINFNVREFARAIKSTDPNELGAIIGSRFNGIVYITSRFLDPAAYPTQTAHGNSSDLPSALCFKDKDGSGNDINKGQFRSCPGNAGNNESSVFSAFSQFVVPVALCTTGTSADMMGSSGAFKRQSCDAGASSPASRPNAVRVYNAGVVDPTAFPKGLTIATDLPLYAYGDINRVQPNSPHMKVALVADRVTFQSRGWRDHESPWFDMSSEEKTALSGAGAPLMAIPSTPTPTGVTVVESSIITGVPLRDPGFHDVGDVFRTTQAWAQNFFIMRGAIVIGWNSEWHRDVGLGNDDQDGDESDDDDDDEDDGNDVRVISRGLRWLPDFHLDNPAFQPPGMPLVSLPPTSRYRQQF